MLFSWSVAYAYQASASFHSGAAASAPNWSGGGNGVGEDGRVGGGAVASRFYGGQEVGVLQWRLEAQERVLYARMVEGGGLASSINFLFAAPTRRRGVCVGARASASRTSG